MGNSTKEIIVIGSGFSGLSAASNLAHMGYRVTILEKNQTIGGRARKFEAEGFTFDMGPSWYWMPDVFEDFFATFDRKVSDYYELDRLDPSYSVIFGPGEKVDLPANLESLYDLFEELEPGSSASLKKFLHEAEYKYRVGMNEFVHKPGHSILEFADLRVLKSLFRLQMFTSMGKYLRTLFRNEKLLQILEFPVLFLGATPAKTPALYSLMNYADIVLGTWYPRGGMHKIVEGMAELAIDLGVKIITSEEVLSINVNGNRAHEVQTSNGTYRADGVVCAADYEHCEQRLLAPEYRTYTQTYWDKRVMAPSSLLFYLGIDRKLNNLQHHNLFFDQDFTQHAHEIYESPQWPSKPLFYVCAPSVTDPTVAPRGKENLFVLMPVAPGLEDNDEIRSLYFNKLIDRLEKLTGQDIKNYIIYKRSFAHSNFIEDYHAFKGNAYGLANTLLQTAFLKPKLRSKKVKNLFFTGQLTTPGPGVPPSIISGQVVATELNKSLRDF